MLQCQEATDEDKSAAFLQVFTVWPHAAHPAEHLQVRLASLQHQRASWFVAKLDGQVVTSLGAYPYQLFGLGEQRSARIFGAVFTQAEFRGHGYAAQLLRWVMQFYSKRSVQDFGLFSDIGTRYYQDLGFLALPSWEWLFDLTEPSKGQTEEQPLQALYLQPSSLGDLGCTFGIRRTAADDRWILAKQAEPLQLSAAQDQYFLLSRKEGGSYFLLESNIPQDAAHWPLFRALVCQDARQRGCHEARGWWTAAAAVPAASQAEILPRDKEILMWTSMRGKIDSWYTSISQHGFRVFASEHV